LEDKFGVFGVDKAEISSIRWGKQDWSETAGAKSHLMRDWLEEEAGPRQDRESTVRMLVAIAVGEI
jgi:hypothetical protein